MEYRVNLLDFDIAIGRHKPRTNVSYRHDACPFCNRAALTDIIATSGEMIFLRNKYNVLIGAEQFVLIESEDCKADIPTYTKEHMQAYLEFAFREWFRLVDSGRYQAVIMFKNSGPLSGGTITHPHSQIIAFPQIEAELMVHPAEFEGILVKEENGVLVNAATSPRIGFAEYNFLMDEVNPGSIGTLAHFLQQTVIFLKDFFSHQPELSYNLFFYLVEGKVRVKVLPRFATSPLYIGYNIHLKPTNILEAREMLKGYLG